MKTCKPYKTFRPGIAWQINQWLLTHPEGATCQEIEANLGIKHQTASPRLNELTRGGLVTPSGVTRNGSDVIQAIPGVPWENYRIAIQDIKKTTEWQCRLVTAARQFNQNPTDGTHQALLQVARND